MYYFVPILLKKPIWSHGLSLVGFWGLAFFYPLQGHSPLSLHADPDVPAVRGGHLDDRRRAGRDDGDHQLLRHDLGLGPGSSSTNLPIRWFYTGMVFYFLTCLQCALQVTLTFQTADSLHRLGRGPRAPGDVRRVQHVAVGNHDLPLPAAARSATGTAASCANGTTGCRPWEFW